MQYYIHLIIHPLLNLIEQIRKIFYPVLLQNHMSDKSYVHI